ncbi:S1 RNA-binding domain-containing protein [Candidatus Uhrbacteria bacterium]|nr:S1 RNA-binding domain-containing protein [Candidatus Uhrbacteria bacterium]
MTTLTQNSANDLKQLLQEKTLAAIPKEGQTVRGTVVDVSSREALVDIHGFKTGIVRGIELKDVEHIYPNLKIGDEVEAVVLELENEENQVELSFRFAGERRAWDKAIEAKQKGVPVEVTVLDANRGGLLVNWMGMKGFLPVSQLSPEHYPRVPGGDKGKILERLKSFVGNTLRLNVLDCDSKAEKLIFSEKALWEEEQKDLLTKYNVGDAVEGIVTAVADFGAFVGFDGLEGLVHISEIAWQRIDNPADLVKVGEKVRAKILNIQGSKIFLSMKALQDDPWMRVQDRYVVGQEVQGKVLKVNPFGLFVELDAEIHGLAHVSELDVKSGTPLEEQIKPGDVRTFRVVSIEPEHHRLGLSEKKTKEEVVSAPDPVPDTEASTPPDGVV